RAGDPAPLVGLVAVVQAEVVVDRLGREDGGEPLGQRLEAVEGAVAAHADEPRDLQAGHAVGHFVEGHGGPRVHEGPRGADHRAPAGRVELGDLGEQRVEVDVGDVGAQEAREALDEAVDLDAALVGADDGALDGGVEGGGVSPGGQDSYAL